MSRTVVRRVLLGLELFTGVLAVYGGVSLLVDATGFGVREAWLRGSPFSTYQLPAVALLVFVAGGNLVAAGFLWMRRGIGSFLSLAAGVVLMGFEVVETFSFGLRNFQQPLMVFVGLLIAVLGGTLWRSDSSNPVRAARSFRAQRAPRM